MNLPLNSDRRKQTYSLITIIIQKFSICKGQIVKNVKTAANKLMVHVEMPVTEHTCPACGCKTSRVHNYTASGT